MIVGIYRRYKHLSSDALWILSWEAITFMIVFLTSILFAHFLTKEEYGLYRYLIALSAIFGSITLTGMNTAVASAVASGKEGALQQSINYQKSWNKILLIATVLVSGYYFFNNNLTIAIGCLIMGICTSIITTYNAYPSFLNAKNAFKSLFKVNVISNTVTYGLIALSIYFTHSALYTAAALFGSTALISIVMTALVFKKYKPNSTEDPSLISNAKHLSAGNFIKIIAGQADKIIIFQYIGASALAIYNFALALPEQLKALQKLVFTIALPRFAKGSKENLNKEIYAHTVVVTFGMAVLVLVYILIAPFVFKTFFSPYVDAIFYSQLIAGIQVISTPALFLLTFLQSRSNQKELLKLTGILSTIDIVILIFSAILYGVMGIIVARYFSSFLQLVFFWRQTRNTLKF